MLELSKKIHRIGRSVGNIAVVNHHGVDVHSSTYKSLCKSLMIFYEEVKKNSPDDDPIFHLMTPIFVIPAKFYQMKSEVDQNSEVTQNVFYETIYSYDTLCHHQNFVATLFEENNTNLPHVGIVDGLHRICAVFDVLASKAEENQDQTNQKITEKLDQKNKKNQKITEEKFLKSITFRLKSSASKVIPNKIHEYAKDMRKFSMEIYKQTNETTSHSICDRIMFFWIMQGNAKCKFNEVKSNAKNNSDANDLIPIANERLLIMWDLFQEEKSDNPHFNCKNISIDTMDITHIFGEFNKDTHKSGIFRKGSKARKESFTSSILGLFAIMMFEDSIDELRAESEGKCVKIPTLLRDLNSFITEERLSE
jgi:hypothetical protein